MYCPHCGLAAKEGATFCEYCGKPFPWMGSGNGASAETVSQRPAETARQPFAQRRPQGQRGSGGQVGNAANADPRRQQIRALRQQIKQLRLELQQVNMQIQQIRNDRSQGAPFVPWGIPNRIYRVIENNQLSGPQQRKQQLQQEILSLQQQILALENSGV
jgi:uncharacterized Zn finger protein (UPF0148 family)